MRPIDADALKEKIDNIWNGRPLSFLGARILATIDDAPTIDADRPQEWIPCSERLPEENGESYLTFQCGDDIRYGWCQVLRYYDGWNCNKDDKENEIKSVVAWMPLPKPWKGIEHE